MEDFYLPLPTTHVVRRSSFKYSLSDVPWVSEEPDGMGFARCPSWSRFINDAIYDELYPRYGPSRREPSIYDSDPGTENGPTTPVPHVAGGEHRDSDRVMIDE
jgi:hypothetical protein